MSDGTRNKIPQHLFAAGGVPAALNKAEVKQNARGMLVRVLDKGAMEENGK